MFLPVRDYAQMMEDKRYNRFTVGRMLDGGDGEGVEEVSI